MRIEVTGPGCNLHLVLPTRMLLNGATASIASRAVRSGTKNKVNLPEITVTPEQFRSLFHCLRECKRNFPGLLLAEVDSADGTQVKICL